MMTAFGGYMRTIMEAAARAAQGDGSATVEAQHLLVAIASGQDHSTRHILASVGLDGHAIGVGLDLERDRSLGAVGVSRDAFDLARTPTPQTPSLGASAKQAIERGLGVARHKRDARPVHLLLGILAARVGTVPRVLDLVGVDRADLHARAVAEGQV